MLFNVRSQKDFRRIAITCQDIERRQQFVKIILAFCNVNFRSCLWSVILTLGREGTTGRTLTTGMSVTGGSAAMTVELCTSACQAANFIYAGVEYAQECCKS